MFTPMNPMTEHTRIQQEKPLRERRKAPWLLLKVVAALRKLFSVRRPEMDRRPTQPRSEAYG